jgi:hypothetical protein
MKSHFSLKNGRKRYGSESVTNALVKTHLHKGERIEIHKDADGTFSFYLDGYDYDHDRGFRSADEALRIAIKALDQQMRVA